VCCCSGSQQISLLSQETRHGNFQGNVVASALWLMMPSHPVGPQRVVMHPAVEACLVRSGCVWPLGLGPLAVVLLAVNVL